MIYQGDCIEVMKGMEAESVHCCVTSPPYWGLRDYGCAGQIGLEETLDQFVSKMVEVFREVRRVLRNDGTIWVNLGDSYARNGGEQGGGNRELLHMEGKQKRMLSIPKGSALKPKDLCGAPWRVALALQADGWYLRSDIIWSKPNPMPESVTDRPAKSHEYIFLLSKCESYHFDAEAIKEPATHGIDRESFRGDGAYVNNRSFDNSWKPRENASKGSFNGKHGEEAFRAIREFRNKRTVWEVSTFGFSEAHFATFPPKLIEPCILAGCPRGGVVLDPFFGSGTTGLVALQNAREFVGIELNPEYIKIAEKRLKREDTTPTMFDLSV